MFANPSAIHAEGQKARSAVEEARVSVAKVLRVRTDGITFTSGGTEANNLALFGTVDHARKEGRAYEDMEIISTRIEHPSILETLKALEGRGVKVLFAPLDTDGRIILSELEFLLSSKTLLVSTAYVNSEIGVVQDIKSIAKQLKKYTKENNTTVFLHTDASQAPLWLPCELDALGVDIMTLDAGKYYGPKGIGTLVRRKHVVLSPYMYGGDQEYGLRPGTENVPLILGCAEAIKAAISGRKERTQRVTLLRDEFLYMLLEEHPQILVNGSRKHRVANNINISAPGVDGEFLVVTLDMRGLACSTRSACSGGKGGGSHVVYEISKNKDRSLGTIRFTLGEETTRVEVKKAARLVLTAIKELSQPIS